MKWAIGIGNRIDPRNKMEMQIEVPDDYDNSHPVSQPQLGLTFHTYDSIEAREYIYAKYGARGLQNLEECLRRGTRL